MSALRIGVREAMLDHWVLLAQTMAKTCRYGQKVRAERAIVTLVCDFLARRVNTRRIRDEHRCF